MAAARVRQAGELRSARIESLRAIAALAVLSCHLWLLSHPIDSYGSFANRVAVGGVAGVNLFFVLSGYLLYRPFGLASFGEGGSAVSLRRYARNRALRILPLYVAVLAVLLVAQHQGGTLRQWARFLTFTQNFSAATANSVDPPMWSLAVELEFYVLLPLMAWAVARLAAGSLRRAAVLLGVVAVASFAVREITVVLPSDEGFFWPNALPGLLYFFVLGMLLALLQIAWRDAPPRWLRGPLASTELWVLVAAGLWLAFSWRFSLESLTGIASVLLVGVAVLPLRSGALARMLDTRVLAGIGVASYSLYLWHYPIVEAVSSGDPFRFGVGDRPYGSLVLISVPIVLAVAAASYWAIERPFLELRRRWAPASPAPATSASAASTA